MEQAMTVYVDHNGYLWTVTLANSYAWVYECGGGEHIFNSTEDAYKFEVMLGMELLGEL